MAMTFRVKAFLALELEMVGDYGDGQYVELGDERFFDSAAQQEIPVFLDMLDKMSEGLDLPAIRAELIGRGYPAEWWVADEDDNR